MAWRTAALLVLVAALVAVPALLPAMPDAVRVPNVRPHPGLKDAVFFHSGHANFMCHNCHPALFPTARVGFTHDDFRDGRFCGACHDGAGAWAVAGADCERCHVGP